MDERAVELLARTLSDRCDVGEWGAAGPDGMRPFIAHAEAQAAALLAAGWTLMPPGGQVWQQWRARWKGDIPEEGDTYSSAYSQRYNAIAHIESDPATIARAVLETRIHRLGDWEPDPERDWAVLTPPVTADAVEA